jgi:hypothetical protein
MATKMNETSRFTPYFNNIELLLRIKFQLLRMNDYFEGGFSRLFSNFNIRNRLDDGAKIKLM